MAKKESENKTTVRVGISETSQELHFEVSLEASKVVALAQESINNGKVMLLQGVKS